MRSAGEISNAARYSKVLGRYFARLSYTKVLSGDLLRQR